MHKALTYYLKSWNKLSKLSIKLKSSEYTEGLIYTLYLVSVILIVNRLFGKSKRLCELLQHKFYLAVHHWLLWRLLCVMAH